MHPCINPPKTKYRSTKLFYTDENVLFNMPKLPSWVELKKKIAVLKTNRNKKTRNIQLQTLRYHSIRDFSALICILLLFYVAN